MTTFRLKLILPLLLLFSQTLSAASVCYSTTFFPSASKLEITEMGIKVYFEDQDNGWQPKESDTYVRGTVGDWFYTEKSKQPPTQGTRNTQGRCPDLFKKFDNEITVSLELYEKLKSPSDRVIDYSYPVPNQFVDSCFEDDHSVLGGLGFYAGEESDGYGGFIHLNKKTNKLEVNYQAELVNLSVNQIASFDGHLWFGTTGYHECHGLPPKEGLLRYENFGRFESIYRIEGMCGFAVHDMKVWNNALWVASDMGVSVRTPETKGNPKVWSHYVPSKDNSKSLREVECLDLYEELLMSLPQEDGELIYSPFRLLIENINSMELSYPLMERLVNKIKTQPSPTEDKQKAE